MGIAATGTFIPAGRQKVETLFAEVGAPEGQWRVFERIHELKQVSMASPQESLEDLLCKAAEDLFSRNGRPQVDLVFYAHSILAQVPAHYDLLGRVLDRLKLDAIPAYGISQLNCASAMGALELIERCARQGRPYRNILLLVADKTDFIPEARYISQTTIMGDSASATLFTLEHPRLKLLSTAILWDTRFHQGFYEETEGHKLFSKVYQPCLNAVLNQALDRAGYNRDDIDWILPHNVNATTWRRFCRDNDFPRDRVLTKTLSDVGHSYCNDNLLNLHETLKSGEISKGEIVAWISVGIGSYFGAAVFQY